MDLHYSQTSTQLAVSLACFTTLWIYTILKLVCVSGGGKKRFTTLWIYTILKPWDVCEVPLKSFTTLWIYTILKLVANRARRTPVLLPYGFTLFSNAQLCPPHHRWVLLPYGFTLFSNYKYNLKQRSRFYYLMDLHYSQTLPHISVVEFWFYYLMDLHYSQTRAKTRKEKVSFTTLWIYTILKQ